MKEISSETDRLTVNLLAYCRTKGRRGESPDAERNEPSEPRSAPAEFEARRKQNFYDKRRTNSDTSMMRSTQEWNIKLIFYYDFLFENIQKKFQKSEAK